MDSEDIKVGDIITTKIKGYWKVIEITPWVHPRNNSYTGKLLDLELVMFDNGRIPNKMTKRDKRLESYCFKITKEYIKESRDESLNKWDKLMNIVSPETETEISLNSMELTSLGFLESEPQILIDLPSPDIK